MKHINITSWKGSITDWTKLNYIKGGLPDYYADIANIKGNYLRKSKNLLDTTTVIEQHEGWKIVEFKVKPNTQYCFNRFVGNSGQYKLLDKNHTVLKYVDYNNDDYHTFTTTANTYYLQITINDSYLNVGMLVEGDTLPTAYEPYGRFVIERYRYRYQFDGTEGHINTPSSFNVLINNIGNVYTDQASWDSLYCNLLETQWYEKLYTGTAYGCAVYDSAPRQYIAFRIENVELTWEAYSEWLATNKPIVEFTIKDAPEIIVVPTIHQIKVSDLIWATEYAFGYKRWYANMPADCNYTNNTRTDNIEVAGYHFSTGNAYDVTFIYGWDNRPVAYLYKDVDSITDSDGSKTIYYW